MGALACVLACQLTLLPGWGPSGASADGTAPPAGTGEPALEPPATGGGPTEAEAEPPGPVPPAEPPQPEPPQSEPPPAELPPSEPPTTEDPHGGRPGTGSGGEAPGEKQGGGRPAPIPAPSGGGESPPAEGPVGGVEPASPRPRELPVTSAAQPGSVSPARRLGSIPQPSSSSRVPGPQAGQRAAHKMRSTVPAGRRSPKAPSSSAPAVAEAMPADLWSLTSGLPGAMEEAPPAYLVAIYRRAGKRYDVPWRVLAAINQVETDYGRNLSVSSAGAVGWMQFMPATWRQWGLDADHDGQANPYSPVDAIFTAGRYLQAGGASHDLAGAIFAYNHADWYVAEVLARARLLGSAAVFARVERGYSLPLDAAFMHELGRTDDGVDIETPPDGALVYSMTPGVVTAVASDPAGFGPDYPVVEASDGELAGRFIYYGHVAKSLVAAGDHVAAGQPIAIVGHTGDAIALGHGHIEIGFSDAGGDPLSHHGTEAATPAGAVMRGILVGLSGEFGIENG
jgi:murein DD-endopeptidase MepM/ murein hydrolase activator NlpD